MLLLILAVLNRIMGRKRKMDKSLEYKNTRIQEYKKDGILEFWKNRILNKRSNKLLSNNYSFSKFPTFQLSYIPAFLYSSILIFSLSSCSHLPDWMGEAKKDSGIKGTRISVLSLESTASADSALADLKITLPEPVENEGWYKSNGANDLVPANPIIAQKLDYIKEVGAGAGAIDGQHINSSPVVADGKVFTISADDKISAFDESNIRKKLWSTKLKRENKKEKFSSAAGITYHEGKLYVATGYNEVNALDASTGKIIWKKTINSIARSAPEISNGKLFINTIDNRLYALNEADGSILWTHTGGAEDISMFGSASPVAYNNSVIAPYSSGEVYSLKIADGGEIWSDVFARRSVSSASTLSDIDAPPVVNSGRIFIISNDGVLASSNVTTGKRMWEQAISGRQSPWVAGDFLYVITNKNEVICLYTPSGGIKWIKQLQAYKDEDSKEDPIKWSGPVLAGNLLWVVSSHGKLMALAPQNGDIIYSRKVPKDIYVAPVVAGGSLYLYSDDAELIKLSDSNVKKPAKPQEQSKKLDKIEPAANSPTITARTKSALSNIATGTSNTTHKMVNGVKELFGGKKTEQTK